MGRAGQAVRVGGLVLMAALAVSVVGFDARADVVEPPPEDCPPGTYADSNHGGPHCAAGYCPDAGACPEDMPCQPTDFCVEETYVVTMSGAFTLEAVVGACPDGQTCDAGVCQRLDVCYGELEGLPRSQVAPNADDDGGCGCRAGAGSGTSAWAALALPLAVGTIRRRRLRIVG